MSFLYIVNTALKSSERKKKERRHHQKGKELTKATKKANTTNWHEPAIYAATTDCGLYASTFQLNINSDHTTTNGASSECIIYDTDHNGKHNMERKQVDAASSENAYNEPNTYNEPHSLVKMMKASDSNSHDSSSKIHIYNEP